MSSSTFLTGSCIPHGGVAVAHVHDAAPVERHSTAQDQYVGDLVLPHVGPAVDGDGERIRAAIAFQLADDSCAHSLRMVEDVVAQSGSSRQRVIALAVGAQSCDEQRRFR